MKWLYLFILAWTRIDLKIARSTGRNPAHIAQLVADEQKWLAALQDLEIQEMFR
jgi:hypothetical protein